MTLPPSRAPSCAPCRPAHWMMPDNKACWPSNGEIDIMEMVNGDGTTHGTYHWQVDGRCGDEPTKHPSIGNDTKAGADWSTTYHEYAVEYSPTHITFVFDGHPFSKLTRDSQAQSKQNATFFDVPYYMILNTAVGGPFSLLSFLAMFPESNNALSARARDRLTDWPVSLCA